MHCGTWNKDEDFCTNCNQAISHKEIVKIEQEQKRIEEANKPKDKFDLFAERLKTHDNVFYRILYKIGYSITLFFGVIGGFLAWVVAMVNA